VDVQEAAPEGRVTCLIDGREVVCTLSGAHLDDVGVTLDDQQFWAQIDGDTVWLGEQRLQAEVVDLRTLALRRAKEAQGQQQGPQAVTSPMPGRVAAVLVEVGQQVQEGEPLLVIEAMKMENELRAPKAGTVQALHAPLGSTVDMGAILCSVD
jgi:biotin carboxyl carrier protein